MDIRMHKFSDKVPEPTCAASVVSFECETHKKNTGETYVYSTQISKQINVRCYSQIAKDLSYVIYPAVHVWV